MIFELVCSLLIVLFTDNIDDFLLLFSIFTKCRSLFSARPLVLDLVEFLLLVSFARMYPILEALNLFKTLSLVSVLLLHLVVLDSLVEFLVLETLFFLLKSLDSHLLFQESTLYSLHVFVGLEHLGKEVIRT